MGLPPALQTFRRLASEVRRSSTCSKIHTESPVFKYILEQYRRYRVTDQTLCKAQAEMDHLARTYLCYLSSTRRANEIHEQYKGRGERTVEDTANIVGFKLPHDPK